MYGLISSKSSDVLNKNTYGAKKGEVNQKQQLSDYGYIATVQLTSKLTLACSEHACVFQFLLCLESKHTCDTKWAAHESTFVYCTRAILCALHAVIICVIHNSKKHASNASCAARKSVFLCATCKLTAVFCHRRIKACTQQNMIKRLDTKKIILCQVFTCPYSRWHFHWTNWMPNMIMAQTRLVAQRACVLYHKAQLRDLNKSTGAPFLIADTMLSLHT